MTKEMFESMREDCGWTKRELAKRLGITERTIHGYMQGNRIPKTVEYLFILLHKKHGEE